MSRSTIYKLAQIAGGLLMAAGVASCQLRAHTATPLLFIAGGVLYAGGRIAAWLSGR